ncbi:phage virion morphogenesis protein [Treponema endosymbiont of Eucomonympha sp.]|uniref:phage virion morphogenesis protein n=1 Tax=Treponema endosymbiont of Eucomonympha sp. TaxID=1580831 RepID=UPI000782F4E0|nr:phage virion morphogenesis protein [Treponema endosymbiont of Eucomonympha sp.]
MGVRVLHVPAKLSGAVDSGNLSESMKRAAAFLKSSALGKIASGVPPPNAPLTAAVKKGTKTLQDRGILRNSIASRSAEARAEASTNVKYARIQQEGGTVKAQGGKKLWIPAGAKTRELQRKYMAAKPGDLINEMRKHGYVFAKSKSGRVFYAIPPEGKNGKRGTPFALFILKDSVEIPARPFLYISEEDERFIMGIFDGAVTEKIQERIDRNDS